MATSHATLSLLPTRDPTSKSALLDSLTSSTPPPSCTTYLLFTPTASPKAPSQLVPVDEKETTIGRLQIESSGPSASPPSDAQGRTSNWTPSAGFLCRDDGGKGGAKASIVMLAKFITKDGRRGDLVGILGNFAEWVKDNEPGVLTYSVMVSADNDNEVLMFERYKDGAALKGHGSSKEFREMFKSTGPHVEGKKTKLNQFDEVSGFVGADVKGKAKL